MTNLYNCRNLPIKANLKIYLYINFLSLFDVPSCYYTDLSCVTAVDISDRIRAARMIESGELVIYPGHLSLFVNIYPVRPENPDVL